MFSFTRVCALIGAGMIAIGGYAAAADTAPSIDNEFARTDAELNVELDRATRQIQATENLGATPITRTSAFRSSADSVDLPSQRLQHKNNPTTPSSSRNSMFDRLNR